MKHTARAVLVGLISMSGLLAAQPALADRVSFSVGVGHGNGGFFAFGLGSGYRHGGYGHPGHCASRPGYFVPPPVVCVPRPIYGVPPPVVPSGCWVEREQRVWVEGYWIETVDACGRRCRTWQPGRWEIRRTREWVQ